MKTPSKLAFAVLLCAGLTRLGAQSAPAPTPTPKPAQDEDTVVLSPFEVTSTKDNGYQATETLAGTRIRTELRDVGSALSVYTKEFLKDIGATDNATLLQYTTNAEVSGTRGTYAGFGNGTSVDESGSLRAPGSAQRVRGLASADNTRDFFTTDIPWDGFNVDRIDIQRGPNSILFGLGSPAGIVNASTKNAEFRNLGSAEVRVGSYGSLRNIVDFNQVLIPKVLSVRFSALRNDEKYQQDAAFQDTERFYGALRFDPQLFRRTDFRTSFKAKFEHGEVDANRPRILPPNDSITPWFRPIDNTSLNGGMGKFSVNNGYEVGAASSSANPWLTGGPADQQQPIWFIDGLTGQVQRIYGGYVNTGARNNNGTVRSYTESLLGQRFANAFAGINNLPSFASNARLPGFQYGQYRTASLQDPSVYNFYENLLDGPTKSEFEKWDAYNLDFSQTGWNDRVGVQVSYDSQKYKRGGQALVTNPTLQIDVLRNFQDLAANPNYGRPFIVGGPGSGNSYESERKSLRGVLYGELRADDFFEKGGFWAKLLGRHRLNGVYSDEEYSTENRNWQMYAHNSAWEDYWSRGNIRGINNRPPVSVIYLGPSLANASSAAGANISGIGAPTVLSDGRVYAFDSTWTGGTNYADPWTIPANLLPIFNPADATTQASNPANYIGWNSNRQINLLRYDNGANLDLLTGANKTLRVTKSLAGSWQAYLWNDAIVATVGWRSDEVKGKGVVANPVSANRNILNLDPSVYRLPDAYPANQVFKDESTSGGVVLHLNRLFERRDPLPINVSLSYNQSSNFQVTDTRRNIYGQPISNPTGETTDYGVLLATKDGKYSFRAVKYKTKVASASTQIDVSGLTATIKNGMNWRNIMLYRMAGYTYSTRETDNIRHDWQPVYVNSVGRAVAPATAATPPAGSTLQTQAQSIAMRDATIRAWNEIQVWLQNKGYFSAWNYTPTNSSALTDRATYAATLVGIDPAAQYRPNEATVFDYRPAPPLQGFAVTADTESEGYEFELTANPTRNWRIAFNAAQTTATRNNIGGPELTELVSYMVDKINGPAGDMRMFNARFDDPANVIWNNGSWTGFVGQYTLFKLQEGAAASELRKWRYNIVTNYSFREGRLKGVGVGGSYRWQDKVIIGYPVVAQGTSFSFDLNQPYYGPAEDATDLWVSYERKLTKKVNWKVQLNVRNLFDKNGLIPISVQPDGKTWAAVRLKPTEEWYLTNTFSF